MAKRKIINIDEKKCNGCGVCIPNCPEGALQMIDGKARLISDLCCDGLGACIGHCPEGAITIEEREAEAYDERKVMDNIIPQGPNVIQAHLEHLKDHGQHEFLKQATDYLKEKKVALPAPGAGPHAHDGGHGHGGGGCPGSKLMDFTKKKKAAVAGAALGAASELNQWPIQIMLVPPFAPYLNNADLLIAADCVPFAYADFHQDLLKGKVLLVGCPKLDDVDLYKEKFTRILKDNNIRSVTCAHMEVPCCFGIVHAAKEAIAKSGKDVPFYDVTIGVQGDKL
ncbi:MAG: 4Fe-4S binding protein [Candidatus Omnitrophota bacterium]